jgi:hypothetical protein
VAAVHPRHPPRLPRCPRRHAGAGDRLARCSVNEPGLPEPLDMSALLATIEELAGTLLSTDLLGARASAAG